MVAMTGAPPWYVITGGPCAGKTTLIKELEKRGYRVAQEAARTYIELEQARGKTLEEIRKDEVGFQHALIPMKVVAQEALPTNEVVFLDRGMHDSIAYLALAGVHNDPKLTDALKHSRYRKVFLLDLLPYVKDAARTEDARGARNVHDLLEKAYRDAGFTLVRVPVMSVKKRADFIEQHLS